jgi:ribosomal protein L13
MLPKNRLGDKLINHLKVVTSDQANAFKAQKPIEIKVG